MAGRGAAVISGAQLRGQVAALGRDLGLEVDVEVRVGRRIRGAQRRIDAVLRHPETRVSPGVGCKFQGTKGTAEEKSPAPWKISGRGRSGGSSSSPVRASRRT